MKIKSNQLTEDQKRLFSEEFYAVADSRLADLETSSPWGAPWCWGGNIELTGETIKEMAINFYKMHEVEILRVIELDESNEREEA